MKSKGFLQTIFDATAAVNKVVAYPSGWSAMMLPPVVGLPVAAVLAIPRIPFSAIGAATRLTAKITRRPLNTDSWYRD